MAGMVGGSLEREEMALSAVLVGRYQLLERIGEGGMGVVWRCFDLDLEEPVAIKFLRQDYAADDHLRASFRREVKLARRVTHPNVARVYEFGKTEDFYFLTMEFVPGEPLSSLLSREGRLPPSRVADLVVSLCRGLAAAHAAGVVHGDIKPSNVLIAPERGAVLTDFGIARALSEVPSGESLGGTPLYMPPEQLLNEAMAPQNDIYAVGVLLFEALTGQVPWPSEDPASLTAYKLAGEPDVRRLAPGLPASWAELIIDCLRSDPARRPANGRAMLTRLAALRGAFPTVALPASSAYPLPSPLATSDAPRWVEVLPFVAAGEPLGDGAWVTRDLVDALTQVRGLRVAVRSERGVPHPQALQLHGSLRSADDEVIVAAEIAAPGQPTARIELRQPHTELHNLGFDLAARLVASLTPGGPRPSRARHDRLSPAAAALYVRARTAFLAMLPDTAVQLYAAALTQAPDHRALRLGHTLSRVAAFFAYRPASREEVDELRAAVAAMLRDHGELGEVHLAHASIALALGDAVAAASAVREALTRAPSLLGAHVLVAELLLEIGRLPDAERHLDIVHGLAEDHALAWTVRARLRAAQGRWDEFDALVDGKLADLRYRSAHLAHLALWQPGRGAGERLAAVFAVNADRLPPPLWQLGRDMLAFGAGQEDRRVVFERLMRHPGFAHPRHNRQLAQCQCELACQVGALDEAVALLARIADGVFADWMWLEFCPLIAPLRADPLFAEVRIDVRAHADVVADALWS